MIILKSGERSYSQPQNLQLLNLRTEEIFVDSEMLCFYSKTGFWPLTDKSQPIWIKIYTHLLLYGIHLWADLNR